jgi:BlaI family penicillinase repressor
MSKQLTKAEEQIMQVLWELNEASVKEVIDKLPIPKPAYNTVSTIIRILETKEFVGHTSVGRGFIYHPIIAKESYSNESLQKLMNGYFEGSFNSMVSFFVKKNKLDISELETILKEINKKKRND